MTLELRPASAFSLGELAALFNAGYEDYFVPFRIDAAALGAMNGAFDVDVEASRVALLDGERVGFANLARRGAEAWIGGVGVVAAARRQGVAEALMRALHDEARSRDVTTVWLEVMEQNEAAYRLYEKLGYDVVRDVEVWTLESHSGGGSAREVAADRAHTRIKELRASREPWQRADATLAHYDDLLGLATDGGAAVFRVGAAVQLLQIAGAETDRNELVQTLRAPGTVSVLNVPTDDPLAGTLRELGANAVVRQHEMVLTL